MFVLKLKKKSKSKRTPWNKGRKIGWKLPLSLTQIRSVRTRLKAARQRRELALFNLAVDSNLKARDIVRLRVCDIARGSHILSRAAIAQLKSKRAIQFEINAETRSSVAAWIAHAGLKSNQHLFPSRLSESPHLSTRQYARLVRSWVKSIGLNPRAYGTQSLQRTRAALIYRRTKSVLAAQLFVGHTRLRTTARFLGLEL